MKDSPLYRTFPVFFLVVLAATLLGAPLGDDTFEHPVLFPGVSTEINDLSRFYTEAANRPGLILLKAAIFDPIKHGPPDLDLFVENHLKSQSISVMYYIVQFTDRVTAEQQRALNQEGGRIIEYIPNNAFLVKMNKDDLEAVGNLPFVRWIGEVHPAYKLVPDLIFGGDGYSKNVNNGTVQFAVEFFDDEDIDASLNRIASLFRVDPLFKYVRTRQTVIFDISIEEAEEFVNILINLNEIKYVGRRPEDMLMNDESIWACQSGDHVTKATPIFDHGLMGQGQVIAVADSGLDKDHCAFVDVDKDLLESQFVIPPAVLSVDNTRRKVIAYNVMEHLGGVDGDETGGHGTHVTGSVAGDDYHTLATDSNPGHDEGDGMAPLARIIMEDGGRPDDNHVYFPYPYNVMWEQEYASGAHISTNSWGSMGNAYDLGASYTDRFIYENQDFLICVSAGNAGPFPESLSFLPNAKNLIAVAATSNGSTGANSIAIFSSKGPAHDGRIKPDLAAPGVNINSAMSEIGAGNCDTVLFGGTSMACPTTAGLAALVRQYFTEGWYPSGTRTPDHAFAPSAALLKATLINSCANITGGNTGHIMGKEDAPAMGQGWGRITLDNALYFSVKSDNRKLLVWDVRDMDGMNTGSVREFPIRVGAGEPLKITLVWTDPPAGPGVALALVDNIDLEVVAADNTIYRGNQWNGQVSGDTKESQPNPSGSDNVNNVEGILIKTPGAGDYLVRVKGINVPGYDFQFSQGFALVVSGDVTIRDIALINIKSTTFDDSSGNGDGIIDPGETISLFVELANTGAGSAGDVNAVLSSSSDLVTITSSESTYGVMEGFASKSNSTAYVFTVDESAPTSTALDFNLDITSTTTGDVNRTFLLKVKPGTHPVFSNLQIEEEGIAVLSGMPYLSYVNINLQFEYSDPDNDLSKLVLFFRVNGENVNSQPMIINLAGLGESGVYHINEYAIWYWLATNTGETLQLYGYLEDITGRRSSIIESNIMTFTLGVTPFDPSLLNDDDSMYIPFSNGFTFPFYGELYTGCWLNSDGNITFESGYEYQRRSPSSHLQAMPRISGLYTDLAKSPGQNNILIEETADHVTFSWNGLPQWAQSGTSGSHTFSLTLFSDGSIDMTWGTCTLNESQGDEFGVEWKGVVGLSPGAVADYVSEDFSGMTSPIPIPINSPIYQGFSANDEFDLENTTIRFEPQGQTTGQTLFFPRLAFVPDVSTEGFGFVNSGPENAHVDFTAYNSDGAAVRFSDVIEWPAAGQGAYQADGLLGLTEETEAWVRAESDQEGLLGFFLTQLFPEGFMAGMDGAEVSSQTVTQGILPRVTAVGDYTTEIFIVNPGHRRVDVMIFGCDGEDVHDGGLHVIEPYGFIRMDMAALFGEKTVFNGYLHIQSTGGILGNAVIRKGDVSLSSVNILPLDSASTTLYASHITLFPDIYFTEVNIISPTNTEKHLPVTVTLTPYNANGTLMSAPFDVTVDAGGIVTLRNTELGLPAGVNSDGWLKLESQDDPIIGCLTFGNPLDNHYESTLPLQSVGSDEVYFAQVANGDVGGVNYFTGVAIINANDTAVDVTISVHADDGSLNGRVIRTLQPGEKYVRLLKTIEGIGDLPDQSSGYLHITGTGPIFAFELFGDDEGNFLSAVPAQF